MNAKKSEKVMRTLGHIGASPEAGAPKNKSEFVLVNLACSFSIARGSRENEQRKQQHRSSLRSCHKYICKHPCSFGLRGICKFRLRRDECARCKTVPLGHAHARCLHV